MNKKILSIVIIVIAALGLAIGGYAILHKTNKTSTKKPTNTAYANNSSKTSTKVTPINNSVLITKSNSSAGQYLASPNGMTLYTYAADSNNTSNCSGSCLSLWPAYQDTGSTTSLPTNIGIFKRSDNGEMQYTFKGMPLYFYVGDKAAGQVTGNGVAGFSVAKP